MNENKSMTNMAGNRPDGAAAAQNKQGSTPRGSGVLPRGVAAAGIDPVEAATDPTETIPQIVREMRALGEVAYSTRIMNAWQRARHNFNVQLAAMRKKVSELSSKADAVNGTVNKTVNEAVNKTGNASPLPLEEKETKEKYQEKEERKELPLPLTSSTSPARAREENFRSLPVTGGPGMVGQPDPSVDEAAAVAMRPTEAQCIAAGQTAGIPEETTRRWLDYMRKCDWHFTSGGIVTRANFRTSLIKWWSREKRDAEEAKNKSGESGQKRRRYMTWQERAAEEREEAERKLQQRLIDISNTVKLI